MNDFENMSDFENICAAILTSILFFLSLVSVWLFTSMFDLHVIATFAIWSAMLSVLVAFVLIQDARNTESASQTAEQKLEQIKELLK